MEVIESIFEVNFEYNFVYGFDKYTKIVEEEFKKLFNINVYTYLVFNVTDANLLLKTGICNIMFRSWTYINNGSRSSNYNYWNANNSYKIEL